MKLFKYILVLPILIGLVNDSYSQCADPPSSTPTLCLGNPLTDITIATLASGISDNGVVGVNGLPPGVAAYFTASPTTYYLSMSGGSYISEKYADITLSNPDLDANGIAEVPYVTDQVWVYDNQQNNPSLDNNPLPGAIGNNGHWNGGSILTTQFGIPDSWVNAPGYSNSDFPQNFPITLFGSPGQSVYFNTWDRYDDDWDGTIWKFTDKPTSDPTHQVIFTSPTPDGGDQTSGSSWNGNPGRLEVTFELKWWDPQPLVGGYSHDANGTIISGGSGGVSSGGIITINGTPLASGVYNYSIPLIGCAGNATGTITITPNNTASAPSATPTLCNNTPLTDITIATTGATGIGTATGLPSGVAASWSANEITVTGTPSQIGTFNYSVPLTGGCGTVNATGNITVTQDNTAAAPSNTPTLCNNTALTDITIATTGATGIGTATGLPSGVTASWSADEVTIIGTPSQVGTFNYSVPLTGGCGIVNATGSITVNYTPVADAPADVTACDSYTLPALTVGNYFTNPNGVGPVVAGTSITTTQTLYVYAETATTPNCTNENYFAVNINYTPVADAPADVTACDSYTLPALTVGNYFTNPNGVGSVATGTIISTTQTLYVYAETANAPNCTNENSFTIIITPIDASTSLSGTTITANLFGVNYTWLDCENNYSVIPGQNTQTFSAFENGNYAVIVNDGSCLDTSECVIVNTVFIFENNLHEVSVYPNPTNSIITIKIANYHGEFEARIYDLSGRLLQVENKNTFSINSFSKGTYILKIVYANRVEDFKVIKD